MNGKKVVTLTLAAPPPAKAMKAFKYKRFILECLHCLCWGGRRQRQGNDFLAIHLCCVHCRSRSLLSKVEQKRFENDNNCSEIRLFIYHVRVCHPRSGVYQLDQFLRFGQIAKSAYCWFHLTRYEQLVLRHVGS